MAVIHLSIHSCMMDRDLKCVNLLSLESPIHQTDLPNSVTVHYRNFTIKSVHFMEMPSNIYPGIADTCNSFADITRCLDISEIMYKCD